MIHIWFSQAVDLFNPSSPEEPFETRVREENALWPAVPRVDEEVTGTVVNGRVASVKWEVREGLLGAANLKVVRVALYTAREWI